MEEKNNHTMIWDKEIKYTAPEKEDLERTRDMFAAAAMKIASKIRLNQVIRDMVSGEKTDKEIYDERFKPIARWAYDLADAMIEEKQRRRNICNVDETTE